MSTFTAVVEKCKETGLYVAYVPGLVGGRTQAETLDELRDNLREVLELISEEGIEEPSVEFIGIETVTVG